MCVYVWGMYLCMRAPTGIECMEYKRSLLSTYVQVIVRIAKFEHGDGIS